MDSCLATSIRDFFAISNGGDIAGVEKSFTENATVLDEGGTHRGHQVLKSWMKNTRSKYQYRVEPTSVNEQGETVTVVASVSGSFPGSPIALNYCFQLDGSKIESLEIY